MWRRVGKVGLLGLAVAVASVVVAQASPMSVPDKLKAPAQNVEHLTTQATGVQVYVCKARADTPDVYEWTFKAPVAELRDANGEQVGTHYAGPTWEANDGSTVVAEVVERVDAPNQDDIPWLLLRAKANHGAGAFSTVTFVQRLETAGGIAPTDGCDPTVAGTEESVEYSATYVFYVWRDDVMSGLLPEPSPLSQHP